MVKSFCGFAAGLIFGCSVWLASYLPGNVIGTIGALSGWAAAFGAIVAASLTLPMLKKQADEAKRQADFAHGEARPTAWIFDPRQTRVGNGFSNRLQVVNWNRSPLIIRKIELVESHRISLSSTTVEDHDTGRREILQAELRRGRLFVPGWVDRTKIPVVAEFDLDFETSDPDLVEKAENHLVRESVTVRIAVTITDRAYSDFDITASRPDALVFAND